MPVSGAEFSDVLGRLWPIVVFLLAITVVAELAERAGVFHLAGHWVARAGRGHVLGVWLLFALTATLSTIFLSLDTTAVLLTPVGIALARQIGVSPLPFALTTLWLANTASLLLPVSNLTNLLALHTFERAGRSHADYVALMWRPALVAIIVTVLVLWALSRRTLRGRYSPDEPPDDGDRPLLVLGLVVCAIVGPLFAIGFPAWIVASAGALVLLAAFAVRSPGLLRGLPLPWLMAGGFVAVSLLVAIIHAQGLDEWLRGLAGGDSRSDLLPLAGAGAGMANVVNNIPAYLALEPMAGDSPHRLAALLVGVNVGPLVTPWASLATLLWLQRCRSAGGRLSPWKLAGAGLLCAAPAGPLSTLAI